MTNNDAIWIGRDGQKYGPYTEAELRQWLREGRVTYETLAWREGMSDWTTLSSLLPPDPLTDGLPPRPPPPPFHSVGAGYSATTPDDGRASFPRPPSMHWLLLFLLSLVTFGVFNWVWMFVQSGWVRKIDRWSHATELFVVALVLAVVGGVVSGPDIKAPVIGGLLILAACGVIIAGSFSVARSLDEEAAKRQLPPKIGGITLFFFQLYYLQGQLSWWARWKDTGQTMPKAPKGVFWLLMIFPGVFAILAAIAIPAYNSYLTRVQVSEGIVLADGAKAAVAAFYTSHGQMPVNNLAAGLALPDDIHGKYTASVTVTDGAIVVTYADEASRSIRNQSLRLSPWVSGSQVNWRCGSDDIQKQYLPVACR